MTPIIAASGMVTGVGLNAPASCAAIRAGVDGFIETRFMDKGGKWIIGCPAPLEQPWRGREKLVRMAAMSIGETLAACPQVDPSTITLMLCVSEPNRPGRFEGLDLTLIEDIAGLLKAKFHKDSGVVQGGRVGGMDALHAARDFLGHGAPAVIVAGVDTFLVAATIAHYESTFQLLTSTNSDGFIPAEAAAAVLLVDADKPQKWTPAGPPLACRGMGFARENAHVLSGEPLRGDGIAEAIRNALSEAGLDISDTDYRFSDTSGEQYRFKEAALALLRVMRKRKETYYMWHPSDCIGEVGAAMVPAILAVALAAARKGYALGPRALVHVGNDTGERAALVIETHTGGPAAAPPPAAGRAFSLGGVN